MIAHEQGHLISKINGKYVWHDTSQPNHSLYEGDGWGGYGYAIENSGRYGVALNVINGKNTIAKYSRDAWILSQRSLPPRGLRV
jgi:hypothetical protein